MDRAWTENDKAPTPERLNNAEQCADPGVFRGQAADVQAQETRVGVTPEISPPRMRVLPARDDGREEDRRGEAATTHPRADHPQAPRGRADARRGRRGARGGQGARGLRADLPPLASAIRRHEGRRGKEAARARARERLLEADRGRQGARGRRPAGACEGTDESQVRTGGCTPAGMFSLLAPSRRSATRLR